MEKLLLSGCIILNDNHEMLLLFRKDHKYYETPGGKVETLGKVTPSLLKTTAIRECYEELGEKIKVNSCEYFGSVDFTLLDGRFAVAHKFITQISGMPVINEPETFSKLTFIHYSLLKKYPLSPDLKLFLPKIKAYLSKTF